MLIVALLAGLVAAYYFGLRAGGWAAGVTLALRIVALFVPRFALAIDLAIAAGVIVLWQVGSRRPRPPEVVLAVRMVRKTVERALSSLGEKRKRD